MSLMCFVSKNLCFVLMQCRVKAICPSLSRQLRNRYPPFYLQNYFTVFRLRRSFHIFSMLHFVASYAVYQRVLCYLFLCSQFHFFSTLHLRGLYCVLFLLCNSLLIVKQLCIFYFYLFISNPGVYFFTLHCSNIKFVSLCFSFHICYKMC